MYIKIIESLQHSGCQHIPAFLRSSGTCTFPSRWLSTNYGCMPFQCHHNSQQQMCNLHNNKIIIPWFAYATNITKIFVLNIGFSKLQDLVAALLLLTAKKQYCFILAFKVLSWNIWVYSQENQKNSNSSLQLLDVAVTTNFINPMAILLNCFCQWPKITTLYLHLSSFWANLVYTCPEELEKSFLFFFPI